MSSMSTEPTALCAEPRRHVEADEVVGLGVLVVLLHQAEREDVGEPRLELAIGPGDDRPFPQR